MSEAETINKEYFETQATDLVAQAEEFIVLTPEQYTAAVVKIDEFRAFQKKVHDTFDPLVLAAHKSHKALTSTRGNLLQPFAGGEVLLKGKCNRYDLNQERLRKEEQERIAAARRKEDEENRKKEADALEKAIALEAEGKPEKAEAVVEKAVQETEVARAIPTIEVKPNTPTGLLRYQDHWTAVITNADAVLRVFCIPDQKKLNELAKLNKGQNAPEGVKFENNRTAIRR